MKRLAIFVEGYSELIFVEQLLQQIAGANNVHIEQRRIRGGATAPRSMTILKAGRPQGGQKYFVLLVDCGGDDLVKTRILEEHESLTRHKYEKIVGIRDVRPKYLHAEIPKLEVGLRKYVKTALIPVEFVLSVMEVEAWFLAEFNHFPRIDTRITIESIRAQCGFDPSVDDMSLRASPADDLNACYSIAGKAYAKSKAGRTISALDYAYVYLELPAKFPHLAKFVASLDDFLQPVA